MKKLISGIFVLLIILSLVLAGCQSQPAQNSSVAPASFQVTYLDVGQADSILVQAGNSSLLIDAGTNSTANNLVKNLKNRGLSRLDMVVGTHPHEDHIGGLDAVINQFDIGKLYMPKVSATTKTFEDVLQAIKNKGLSVTTPVPGTSFSLGSATGTILAPNGQSYADLNNYSIVIRMFYGSTSFLFTGDAQAESEKEMLTKGYTLKSDVLKVGHHGSESSTTSEFLKAVSPKYAVISVGQGNDYGHPHQVTLDKLNAAGVKIYRTDLNGNITITSDGLNLAVKTEK